MIEQLQWLSQNGKPWAAQRAAFALEISQQFQQGAISESEYKELMHDLVRADKLDEEADDIETKALLVSAIYAIAQVA